MISAPGMSVNGLVAPCQFAIPIVNSSIHQAGRYAGQASRPRREAAAFATRPSSSAWASSKCFYEDALVAARPRSHVDIAVEGCGQQRHLPVRRAVPRDGRLPREAGEERLSSRHLRAGRGSKEGEGVVKREVVRVVSLGTLTDGNISTRGSRRTRSSASRDAMQSDSFVRSATRSEIYVKSMSQGRKSLPIMPGCSMEPEAVRRDSRDFAIRGSSCALAPSSLLH